ncbi:TetR/AcrR family transcriptional regulator [Limnohabitans sp. Rim8]|uniref:TetR/AcrR family transcriptional regulator n=1 Tax=Limnohabitans sp. Rim8 TaxID=1100718 RepID=UPI0026161BA4|nr:TetR/AcrR family transcriptional regulator [Limnohabitans sp. Rim8]
MSTLPIIANAQSRPKPSKIGKTTTLSLIKVFPAKQQRSEQTHEKLLQAGLDLLKIGIIEDISIAQISARAGCSVGSFYLRFRNKEAFFEFLIESISETLQAGVRSNLTKEKVKGLTLAQTVRLCVDDYVQTNRQYEGVIRAALQYSINGSDDWQPVRDNGLMLHAHYIDLIIAKLRRLDHAEARQQLLVGLQIISGHLVNSIAHPVNTLPLDHPDLSHWLFEVLMHCLKIKPPAPAMQQQKKTPLRTASPIHKDTTRRSQ